jgi:hypothetical protein
LGRAQRRPTATNELPLAELARANPHLIELELWKSNVTPAGLQELENICPTLSIKAGP